MIKTLKPVAAALLALAASASPASAAEGDVWRLQKIVLGDHLDPAVTLSNHYADSDGGTVGLKADGALSKLCPGGSTTLDFYWQMPNLIEIKEGSSFDVQIYGSGYGDDVCKRVIASGSFITAGGSKDAPDLLSPATMKAVDKGRFVNTESGAARVPAGDGEWVDIRRKITLAAYPAEAKRPLAYFQVRIDVNGSARGMEIVYVYSKDGPPADPPVIGEQLPPPG